MAGSGIGAAVLSVMLRLLFPKIGFRNTMLVWAAIIGVCQAAALFLVKIRLPPPKPEQAGQKFSLVPVGVWKDPAWYLLGTGFGIGLFG